MIVTNWRWTWIDCDRDYVDLRRSARSVEWVLLRLIRSRLQWSVHCISRRMDGVLAEDSDCAISWIQSLRPMPTRPISSPQVGRIVARQWWRSCSTHIHRPPFDSPYAICCWWAFVTERQSTAVFEILSPWAHRGHDLDLSGSRDDRQTDTTL